MKAKHLVQMRHVVLSDVFFEIFEEVGERGDLPEMVERFGGVRHRDDEHSAGFQYASPRGDRLQRVGRVLQRMAAQHEIVRCIVDAAEVGSFSDVLMSASIRRVLVVGSLFDGALPNRLPCEVDPVHSLGPRIHGKEVGLLEEECGTADLEADLSRKGLAVRAEAPLCEAHVTSDPTTSRGYRLATT